MLPIDKARESRFDALDGSSNFGHALKQSPTPRNETHLMAVLPHPIAIGTHPTTVFRCKAPPRE